MTCDKLHNLYKYQCAKPQSLITEALGMRNKARAEFTIRGEELGPVRCNSSQLKPTKTILKQAKISAKEVAQRFQRFPFCLGGKCAILPTSMLETAEIKRGVVEIFEIGQTFLCMASAVPGRDPLSFTNRTWDFMSLDLGQSLDRLMPRLNELRPEPRPSSGMSHALRPGPPSSNAV